MGTPPRHSWRQSETRLSLPRSEHDAVSLRGLRRGARACEPHHWRDQRRASGTQRRATNYTAGNSSEDVRHRELGPSPLSLCGCFLARLDLCRIWAVCSMPVPRSADAEFCCRTEPGTCSPAPWHLMAPPAVNPRAYSLGNGSRPLFPGPRAHPQPTRVWPPHQCITCPAHSSGSSGLPWLLSPGDSGDKACREARLKETCPGCRAVAAAGPQAPCARGSQDSSQRLGDTAASPRWPGDRAGSVTVTARTSHTSQDGARENTADQTRLLSGLMSFQVWSMKVKAPMEQAQISERHLTFRQSKRNNMKATWHALDGLKTANQHVSRHNHLVTVAN